MMLIWEVGPPWKYSVPKIQEIVSVGSIDSICKYRFLFEGLISSKTTLLEFPPLPMLGDLLSHFHLLSLLHEPLAHGAG